MLAKAVEAAQSMKSAETNEQQLKGQLLVGKVASRATSESSTEKDVIVTVNQAMENGSVASRPAQVVRPVWLRPYYFSRDKINWRQRFDRWG